MKNFILLFLFTQFCTTYAKTVNIIIADTTNVVNNKNITYVVTQDSKNVFISVETDDKKASQALLKEGVTVYFDVKGKKKKNVFVRYPNKLPKPNRQKQQQPQPNTEENLPNREELIEGLPQEAIYSHFNSKREFHILLNDLDTDISLDILKHNRIKYNLRIPKHRINKDPKKSLEKLSIGVLIGRDQTDRPGNDERPGGQSGGRGGNSQGGGPPGGGGSGGGPPGGGNGGGNGGGQRPTQENRPQISIFWFKANSI